MDDIAALSGAAVVRDELGMKLESLSLEQLGFLESATASRDETVLVGAKGQEHARSQRG